MQVSAAEEAAKGAEERFQSAKAAAEMPAAKKEAATAVRPLLRNVTFVDSQFFILRTECYIGLLPFGHETHIKA